jgi:hypothetical protein
VFLGNGTILDSLPDEARRESIGELSRVSPSELPPGAHRAKDDSVTVLEDAGATWIQLDLTYPPRA